MERELGQDLQEIRTSLSKLHHEYVSTLVPYEARIEEARVRARRDEEHLRAVLAEVTGAHAGKTSARSKRQRDAEEKLEEALMNLSDHSSDEDTRSVVRFASEKNGILGGHQMDEFTSICSAPDDTSASSRLREVLLTKRSDHESTP